MGFGCCDMIGNLKCDDVEFGCGRCAFWFVKFEGYLGVCRMKHQI